MISRSALANRTAKECDCEDIALLEAWCDLDRLVGRCESRLVDVGMDSGMGSDIVCVCVCVFVRCAVFVFLDRR